MKNSKYVVVTPVRDEADNIEKTIYSMVMQTCLPERWIIIDDGSTDDTPDIISKAVKKHKWISAVYRTNRGYRKAGGGVIEAFYEGYRMIENLSWEYIVKLDGDISFQANYFERCFKYFELEPELGVGGGTIFNYRNGRLKVDSANDPPFHVRGATKIYRRKCWMQISPLVKAPGWDTIDEIKANMLRWSTRTFKDIILIQHKPTGAVDGGWKNWFKNGQANYFTGYHPGFMLLKCLKRLTERPFPVPAIALAAGYFTKYLRKEHRLADLNVINYIRKEQIRRIFMKSSIYG